MGLGICNRLIECFVIYQFPRFCVELESMLGIGLMLTLFLHGLSSCTFESRNGSETSSATGKQECAENPYRHKSIEELSAMSPSQLIDESIKEQLYHQGDSSNVENHDNAYAFSFDQYLKKVEVQKLLTVLTQYLVYDPGTESKCKETGFFVASATVGSIDNGVVRLRALPEGRLAIAALEKSVQRLKDAGLADTDHDRNYLFNLSAHQLEMAKGTSIRDEIIRATLEVRHKIQMSESEYLEFSNYLTSVDPKYPTWSEVGEYGPPTLVKDSQKYFDAYAKFKSSKGK